MQTNPPYPFNQKQHIFDFKVKVNFENGNVSLTAPQIVSPPAFFNPISNQHQIKNYSSQLPQSFSSSQHNIYTQNIQQQPYSSPYIPQYNSQSQPRINLNNSKTVNSLNQFGQKGPVPVNYYQTPSNQMLSPFKNNVPVSNNSSGILPNQNIQLVDSSYTSFKQTDFPINNSMQMIECVICQKSFNINEFDQHLQLHKNRNSGNNQQTNKSINNVYSNQKSTSNNYHTQNSFNAANQSSLSQENSRSQHSFNNGNQNVSYSSHSSKQSHTPMNNQVNILNQSQNNHNVSKQGKIHLSAHQNKSQQNSSNSSIHLLGRIDNPILALNAAQQTSFMSQSYQSSHPYNNSNPSLNYSNSSGQQLTTRFADPSVLTGQIITNPFPQNLNNSKTHNYAPLNAHNNSHSSSSFGQNPGINSFNPMIGPSFYQNQNNSNSLNEISLGNQRFLVNDLQNQYPNEVENTHNVNQGPFVKGVNRLAYHQGNSSIFDQNQINKNNSINNQLHQNERKDNYQNNSLPSNHQYSSHHSNRGSHSNHSLPNNFIPNNNQVPLTLQHFQSIQSRYSSNQQPFSQQSQLYYSQSNFERQSPKLKDNLSQQKIFQLYEDDISSISRTSRVDMSRDSDFSSFQNQYNQDLKLQGYNSADNSLMKNIQKKDNNKRNKQQNTQNIYIQRDRKSQNNHGRTSGEQGFFKKKKDYMINSATSYYDKRFKDQDLSSSDEQDYKYRNSKLSYAERLRQKRATDGNYPIESCHDCKSNGRNSKTLKNSSKKELNGSKYSQSSQLSKTKLPVNYLARQQFISNSTNNTKSTHKTNAN